MDVKEFFETYTETAAIVKMETEGSFPSGSNDAICFPSDDDHSILFYLRNPKKFTLEPRYTFNNPDISVTSADMEFTQNPSDKSLVTLKFKQSFLQTQEETCNLEAKDLSGVVSFYEPMSGRVFDSYKVNVHANTIPPAVLNPCFQLTSSGSDAEYIVCFYLPKLASINQIHKDTYNLYVNNEHLYVNGASTSDFNIYQTRDDSGASVSYQNADTRFSQVVPSSMTSLEENGFAFSASACPAGYVPVYFMTGVAPTTDTTTYTFTISDDDGLSNSISISNKAKQLESPTFNVTADTVYSADEETYLYTLRINHSGLCTDGSSSGAVRINYTITERNHAHVFAAGSSDTLTQTGGSSVEVRLPKGEYDVTAIAIKDYYIASAAANVENFKVRTPAIFYVSETGEDNESRSGSRDEPLRTINYAFTQFKNGVTSSAYDADGVCDIRLLSDITPPDDYVTSEPLGWAFVGINSFTGTLKITGYGGVRKIDAACIKGTKEMRVMHLGGGTITLENLIITGGIVRVDGPGVPTGSGINITNGVSSVTINNCTITSNTGYTENNSPLYGGGIYSDKDLSMTNCTVSYNTLSYDSIENNILQGAGIYLPEGRNRTLTLTNCKINNNTGGNGLFSDQTEMTGGSVKDNIASSNSASQTGAGIWGGGNFTNVEISGNYFESETTDSTGAGIYIYNSEPTVLKNCNIHDNKAMTAGAIQLKPGSSLTLENCTVKDNTSYGSTDDPTNPLNNIGGISTYDPTDSAHGDTFHLTLKGRNYIYGNKKKNGSPAINLYVRKNTDDEKVQINGNISTSTIGFYYDFAGTANEPTAGNPKVFTNGYNYPATNTKLPAEVFIAENGYGILPMTSGADYGEAAFAVSSASIYDATDYIFAPEFVAGQSMRVYQGVEKVLKLTNKIGKRIIPGATPTYQDLYYKPGDKKLYENYDSVTNAYSVLDPSCAGTAVAEISAALYSGGTKVCDLDVNGFDITVAADSVVAPGNYKLKVFTSFLGRITEKTFTIAIDHKAETVAEYIDSLTASPSGFIFVEGPVGPGLTDGLALVAEAIKNKNSTGITIKLDATETINSDETGNYSHPYFKDCQKLTEIKLPDWMYAIIPSLFEDCTGLTSVTLGANITRIYQAGFKGCTSLSSITLPASIKEIELEAFTGCNNSSAITINFAGTKEQWGKIRRPAQTADTKWHDGATDERESAGSVTCTDGNCGIDYRIE